jgi:hypothetical protein
VKVFLTNHQPETLNYKYGRNMNNMTIEFTSTSLCMECNGALLVNDDSVTDSAGNTCTSAYDGNAALCGTLDVVGAP